MSIGMFRQRTIAKDALLAVVLLLITQLAFGGLIVYLLGDTERKLADQRHRLAVVSSSNRIADLIKKFGILLIFDLSQGLRNSATDTNMWQSLSARIESEFRRLRALAIEDLPAQEILQEQEKIFRTAEAFYKKELVHINDRARLSTVKVDPSSLVVGHDIFEHYQELLTRYQDQKPAGEILSANTLVNSLANVKGVLVGAFFVDLVFTFTLLALVFSRLVTGIAALTLNLDRYKNEQPLVDFPSSGDELAKLDKLLRESIQALENSARYEMTLVDGASDVIFRLDSEGRIRDLNAAAMGQWGYQPSELEGAPWQTLVPTESQQELRDFLSSLPQQDHSSALELAIKSNDGELVDSRLSCYWSAADRSTFCFVSDIGVAKHQEEELREKENDVRMLMRNLPIGLVVVDQFGAFLSTNERMEQMLKSAGNSTSVARCADDVFSDSDVLAQARRGSQLRTQLGHREIGNREISSRKADGLVCEITVVDLIGSNETLLVVEDVSEKLKLENLRKDFLQLLWRNLGEPILKVKQMVLGIEVTTEKEQARVQKFVLNVNRLLRLLDELLRLEELAPGKLVGAQVPIKASDLTDSAIASLADFALNQGIKLEVQMTPQTVLADFERVVQVLINLISNAIKFSFKGGTVLLQVEQAGDQVEFSVIDSGRGVPLAKQAQIFQAYGQASVSDAGSGTGLGLAICQSIVEAHGGTIGVENRETGGSRFWFKLPRLEVSCE